MFDGSDHQVLGVFAGDAAGGGDETHGFLVAAVEGKGDADPLAFVVADLAAIGTPSAISLGRGDAVIMTLFFAPGMALEPQVKLAEQPSGPLGGLSKCRRVSRGSTQTPAAT